MRIYLDTNVVIDFINPKRDGHDRANHILTLAMDRQFEVWISPLQLTQILRNQHRAFKRIVSKTPLKLDQGELGQLAKGVYQNAVNNLKTTLSVCHLATIEPEMILATFRSDWNDLEDCLQHEIAKSVAADYLLTNNKNDFQRSTVPVLSPGEFLELLT